MVLFIVFPCKYTVFTSIDLTLHPSLLITFDSIFSPQNLELLILLSTAPLRFLSFLSLSTSLTVHVPLFSQFPYTIYFLSSFLIHLSWLSFFFCSSLSSLFTHNPSSFSSSFFTSHSSMFNQYISPVSISSTL